MTRITHVPNEHKYSIYYNDINGNIKNTKKKIIKKLNWMKLQKQDKFSKIFMITYYKSTMKPLFKICALGIKLDLQCYIFDIIITSCFQ